MERTGSNVKNADNKLKNYDRDHANYHDSIILMIITSYFYSFTGTSGTLAWELEEQGMHLIIMWSVPYNLNIYNSYFGVGVVQLTTRFNQQMQIPNIDILLPTGSHVTCCPTGTTR